jgi:low temperature requirement protein LtrA
MPVGTGDTRHLRRRDGDQQETTAVELFFDLVYVLAVTQLSHLLIADLSWGGAGRAAFLLVVVWWAWIYTTWMVNWFDPDSTPVRALIVGVTLASLLMAAALPEAFTDRGMLFAGAYVALQVGRNAGTIALVPEGHPLHATVRRLLVWSVVAGLLWLGGGLLEGDGRLVLWAPALALELSAPFAGYWTPGLGRMELTSFPVEGGHFAERFQAFIIIALGESIVVTGATAADVGLSATVVVALAIAFLETAALWWLYFGEAAVHSRQLMREVDDPTTLARDAYTYLHLPIVAGIILSAVGDDLVLAHPHDPLTTAGAIVVLGAPILYLAGELAFRYRMVRTQNRKRLVAIAALALLGLLAGHVSGLLTSALVAGLLTALGLWEFRPAGRRQLVDGRSIRT